MTRVALRSGWQIAASAPGRIPEPDRAALQGLSWIPAQTLGTVAAVLRGAGRWDFHDTLRFDASDWWYRLRFEAPGDGALTLGFDGLATVADVWLNGQHLLSSNNMFIAHIVRAELRPGENELLLRFGSLDALLQVRRPRPRWRAPMVEHQQLRWFRTTLLGRTPGWSPPAAAVGPWRPIWMESAAPLTGENLQLHTSVVDAAGIVSVEGRLTLRADTVVESVMLVLDRGGTSYRAQLNTRVQSDSLFLDGQLRVPDVALWWPHTHGDPVLYDAQLDVQVGRAATPQTLTLRRVGFRSLGVERAADEFALRINGERVFCRGACWTPPDSVALDTPAATATQAIEQMAVAGMNMVRVSGAMVYENDAFLDACDARGMLLWQDFMFANMDYPDQDRPFRASVSTEAGQLLARLAGRPCITILCGNSEVEQQAAMWGAARPLWSPGLFHDLLPTLCAAGAPGIPYWPSSAHGGAFPHQADAGTASYYGVGAYLRPLDDARRAQVRFATECLGLANVPEEALLSQMAHAGGVRVHSPLWKSRTPRDLGAGWDFDDVRDHYLREIFGVEALAMRYAEPDRYLEFSRAVSGEVMTTAFREWRRVGSACNGALVWFLRDLWPGAGWGIIDASGEPKCAYYCLARLLQPRTVFVTDEGVNGLYAHLINETRADLNGALEIALIPGQGRSVRQRTPVNVPARHGIALPLVGMLDGFSDLSYAYRFGPVPYEAVRVALLDQNDAEIAHDFHFLLGHRGMPVADPGLTADAQVLPDGDLSLELHAQRLARFVSVRVPGYRASDQYFHLSADAPRRILLRNLGTHDAADGEVRALNAPTPRKIMVST